jgi:hypothetical protein
MPESTSNCLAALTRLIEKVAVELIYASPGKDDGLLPINSMLSEMEEIGGQSPVFSPLPQALVRARQIVDSAFDKAALEATHINQLGRWVNWMQHALPLAQAGKNIPDLPSLESTAPPSHAVKTSGVLPQDPLAR